MANNTVLIKLGGSSITDVQKPLTPKRREISRLLREITEAKRVGNFDVIIGHGSGSFGHAPSKKYKINERGVSDNRGLIGAVITEQETSMLNRIVIDVAAKNKIPVFSFAPHSFGIASNLQFTVSYGGHIISAMKVGFIPLVYGDIVIDSVRGAADISTEEVLRSLSTVIRPNLIVIGTDVDGLFTKDPKTNKDAKLIDVVSSSSIAQALKCARGSTKIDSTGGMNTKVSSLYAAVQSSGAIGYIVNATKRGLLRDVLLGQEVIGTVFRPE